MIQRETGRADELLEYLLGGATVASPKIAALDLPTLHQLISQLARYDDFSETVGRFDDHAFGMFDFQGATIVFKIEMTSLAAVGQSRSNSFRQSRPDHDDHVCRRIRTQRKQLRRDIATRSGAANAEARKAGCYIPSINEACPPKGTLCRDQPIFHRDVWAESSKGSQQSSHNEQAERATILLQKGLAFIGCWSVTESARTQLRRRYLTSYAVRQQNQCRQLPSAGLPTFPRGRLGWRPLFYARMALRRAPLPTSSSTGQRSVSSHTLSRPPLHHSGRIPTQAFHCCHS